jgi:hypothetical protein
MGSASGLREMFTYSTGFNLQRIDQGVYMENWRNDEEWKGLYDGLEKRQVD